MTSDQQVRMLSSRVPINQRSGISMRTGGGQNADLKSAGDDHSALTNLYHLQYKTEVNPKNKRSTAYN